MIPTTDRLDLAGLLTAARNHPGLSDLHLLDEAQARIDGRLGVLGARDDVRSVVDQLEQDLSDDERMRLLGRGDVTVRRVGPWGLVRVHLYRERGRTGAAIRFLSPETPSFDSLGLPAVIREFASAPGGIVLVCGPVGVGKSSTLAALVREMDAEALDRHVRVIESPTEWIHEPKHLVVSHVSVGSRLDADSYASAVSSAQRSDAQVIVIGELFHDDETISVTMDAVGSGSLVFATMHAPTVSGALDAILDAFPPEAERRLRSLLASRFIGGVSLRLLPRQDGAGRVPAAEIVVATDAIRNMIRSGDFTQLRGQIETGGHGMQTLEGDLNRLISAGKISSRDAKLVAARPNLVAE
jgi:twitching motility protein PilT